MEIIDRIFSLLQEKNIEQKDFAEAVGVRKQAITEWKNGTTKSYMRYLDKIAEYFDVPVSYLLGETNANKNTPAKKGRGIKIPVLGEVPAGIPIEAVEDIIDYEEITPEMARLGDHFALLIKGDSMAPRMVRGDVVVVRKQDYAETGDTVIVLINGADATCKKIKITDKGWALISTNPAYEPMFFSAKEVMELPVQILGKVVELRGKF